MSMPYHNKLIKGGVMQAKRLKDLLDTDMIVSLDITNNLILIGSDYITDIIKINTDDNIMIYSMGLRYKDRSEITSQKILTIWDKLQVLLDDGTLADIMSKDDVLDNPAIVYRVIDGELKTFKATGDKFPHTLLNGELIYNNVYFRDPCTALIHAYSENALSVKYNKREINEISKRLNILHAEVDKDKKANFDILNNELPKLLKNSNKRDIETIVIPDCMLDLLITGRNIRIREDATESLHTLYKKRKTGIIISVVGETTKPPSPIYAFFMDNYTNGESIDSGVTLAYIKNSQ